MNSLGEDCTPLKQEYDTCFHKWFKSVFLKGKDSPNHNEACGQFFQNYQTCLNVNFPISCRIMWFWYLVYYLHKHVNVTFCILSFF